MADMTTESYKAEVRAVWRVTAWLLVITIVEVVFALLWLWYFSESIPRLMLNSFFIVASLLKAYFIVGEFMHIKYETRALTISIIAPMAIFIWFIIAFLMEGTSWGGMKTGNFLEQGGELLRNML